MVDDVKIGLRTEFEDDASARVAEFRSRVRSTSKAVRDDFESLTRVTRQLDIGLKEAGRQSALDIVRRDALAAVASGQDLVKVLGVVEQQLKDIGEVSDRSIQDLGRDITSASRTAQQAQVGGEGRGGRIARAGRELALFPAVQTPLGISTDQIGRLARVGAVFDRITVGANATTAAAGAAGVALVAMVAAISLFAKSLGETVERANAATRSFADQQSQLFQELQAATSEDAATALRELESAAGGFRNEALALEAQIAAAEAALNRVSVNGGALETFAEGSVKAGEALGLLGTPIDELQAQLDETNIAIADNATAVAFWEDALENGKLAVNDIRIANEEAAEAERRRAEEIRKFGEQLFEQQISTLVDASISGGAEALRERQSAIETEIDILNSFINTANLSEAQTQRLSNQITLLTTEFLTIETQALDAASAVDAQNAAEERLVGVRERAAAQVEAAIATRLEAAQNEADALRQFQELAMGESVDALRDRQQAIAREIEIVERQIAQVESLGGSSEFAQMQIEGLNEQLGGLQVESAVAQLAEFAVAANELRAIGASIAELSSEIADSQAELQRAIAEAEADSASALAESIAEANAEAATERLDAQGDFNDDLEDLEEDHQKRLLRINRRANATIANAISNRDAVAFVLAKQQQAEELATEQEAFEDEQQQLDEALRERLNSIDENLDEQLAKEREAAQKSLRNTIDRLRERQQTEEQAAREEIRSLEEKQRALQNILRNATAQEQLIIQQGADANINIISSMMRNLETVMVNGANDIVASVQTALAINARPEVVTGTGGGSPVFTDPDRVVPPGGIGITAGLNGGGLSGGGMPGININVARLNRNTLNNEIMPQIFRQLSNAIDRGNV
jgi:hypothetical protein